MCVLPTFGFKINRKWNNNTLCNNLETVLFYTCFHPSNVAFKEISYYYNELVHILNEHHEQRNRNLIVTF